MLSALLLCRCSVVSTAYLAARIRLKEEAAAKAAIINGRAFGTARMLFSSKKKKPKKRRMQRHNWPQKTQQKTTTAAAAEKQQKAAVLADKQQNSEFRPRSLSDLYYFNKKRRNVCLRAVLATATAAAKEFATADVLRKHLQLTPNCNLTRVIKSPSSAAAVVSLVSGG